MSFIERMNETIAFSNALASGETEESLLQEKIDEARQYLQDSVERYTKLLDETQKNIEGTVTALSQEGREIDYLKDSRQALQSLEGHSNEFKSLEISLLEKLKVYRSKIASLGDEIKQMMGSSRLLPSNSQATVFINNCGKQLSRKIASRSN